MLHFNLAIDGKDELEEILALLEVVESNFEWEEDPNFPQIRKYKIDGYEITILTQYHEVEDIVITREKNYDS